MTRYDAVKRVALEHQEWLDRIRACFEWTIEQLQKGGPVAFRRDTIYYRLGVRGGLGPPLTPLLKWQVIEREFTNARGTPYYRLRDEDGVGRALRELSGG